MLLLVISIIFLIGYAVLLGFYMLWWRRLPVYQPYVQRQQVNVSVVIAARNEAENIGDLLTDLNRQTYPKTCFEIIVIDDHSSDETVTIIENSGLHNLKLIRQQPHLHSKKSAINAGVEAAKGELLIITDADCSVLPNWIQTHVDFYLHEDVVFTAAPVAYHYDKNVLQILQSIDFLTMQGITAASVSGNFHSMCNGANLAYTKNAFKAVNGFEGIDKVASGDDMLLMYKIWKQHPQKVKYLKSKEAIITTKPMRSWKQFFNQRMRWASKTAYYDDKRVFWSLVLVYITNLLFVILLTAGFFNTAYFGLAIAYLVVKTAIELPFVYDVSKFYGQQRLLRYFFFLQPLHIFYIVFIGFISQVASYRWKGRKTK